MTSLWAQRLFGATLATLAVMGAVAPSGASGLTSPEAGLAAIVRADSTRYQPAVASAILDTSSGSLALVAYFSTRAEQAYADVYRYQSGAWRLLARVNPGRYVGPPNPKDPPLHVAMTGATDFAVSFETANVDLVAIVSDVGGRWHAVPFTGGRTASGGDTLVFAYGATRSVISGRMITSGFDDCVPDCASGTVTYTTWAYNAAARAFMPAPKVAAPSSVALTPVPISAVTRTVDRQIVAYFVIPARGRRVIRASEFRASVAWGDGTSSPAVVKPSGRVPAGFRGPRRVLEFEVDAGHTYATTAASRATVTVTGASSGSVQVAVNVESLDPVARFYSNPVTATAGRVALLVPAQPGLGQRAISSYVWTFGDGSRPVQDTPALRPVIMGALRKLRSHPGSPSLRYDAYFLGIIPTPSAFQLTSGAVQRIAELWLDYFPRHMIPHIYPSSGVFAVSLQVTDAAGVSSIESRDVGVEPHCVSWSGWGPLKFVAQGTCETILGFQALTKRPNRSADYMAFAVGASEDVGSGGASITVARDGTVFVAAGAGVGVGAGTPDVSIAAGYVGLANLPKGQRRPTNRQIDSFIDNWTIPVQGYVSGYYGLGAGGALIYSPGASGPKIGEEYQLHGGIGGGVSIQASCAVRLGKIKELAALSAASVAPGLAEVLIHRYLRTLLADAGKALADSVVCQRGVTAPSTILFGGS